MASTARARHISWHIGRVLYKTYGLSLIVAGVIAGSLLMAATLHTGPGMDAYLPWAAALIQATPRPLHSITLSPTGFPLVQQYLGTGVFLAIPKLFSGGLLNLEESSTLAGTLAVLFTMAGAAALLYNIAGNRIGLVLLGISLLLVATNTGYYITLFGAELFALALVMLATWFAWTSKKIGNLQLAGLGALAALLMTVRPQSLIMVSPPMFLGLVRWARGRRRPQFAGALLYCGVPLAFGLLIVLQFNYWMTGEWLRSPYYFGNDQFKSIDLSGRYLGLVLFDSKAGLLSCTPFIALGLGTSLLLSLDRRLDWPHRVFYLTCLLSGLAEIWTVAGFYGWAGGYWRFGSRHLNLLAVYAVLSVVHFLAAEQIREKFKFAVLGLSVACAAYSATRWGLSHLPAAIIIAGSAAVLVALSRPLCRDTVLDLVCGLFGVSFLCAVFYYYAWYLKVHVVSMLSRHEMALFCGAAVIATTALFSLWNTVASGPLARTSVAITALAILTLELTLVVRLRAGAAHYQARELNSPSRQFLYKNRIHMEDLEVNLQQESFYRWPEKDRRAMQDFLEQEKRRTAILRRASAATQG